MTHTKRKLSKEKTVQRENCPKKKLSKEKTVQAENCPKRKLSKKNSVQTENCPKRKLSKEKTDQGIVQRENCRYDRIPFDTEGIIKKFGPWEELDSSSHHTPPSTIGSRLLRFSGSIRLFS